MDALSDVLRNTRLAGGLFLQAEFSDPWCLQTACVLPDNCAAYLSPNAEIIPYHYVLEGRLRLQSMDGETVDLPPGGVALLPGNEPHLLGGDLGLKPTPTEEVVNRAADGGLAKIKFGGGGAVTKIVCGFLAGKDLRRNPALGMLPPLLHFEMGSGSSADWIRSSFSYAAQEITAGHPGSESVMAKISELLLVDAIRRYVDEMPADRTGWLAGLKDPFLARALALMHRRLAHAWTVDELGREVGMSRSALAERFGEVIGMPPMQYLTQWRMQVAQLALHETRKSILQIAREVGYDTEATFSRAFKRVMQVPPASWRRMHQ